MKPNNFSERVADFELKEKGKLKKPESVKSSSKNTSVKESNENPYLQARNKVLATYSKERLDRVMECERLNKLDDRVYNQFILDILIAAGDIPTHELRKKTEECGCFSCKKNSLK